MLLRNCLFNLAINHGNCSAVYLPCPQNAAALHFSLRNGGEHCCSY